MSFTFCFRLDFLRTDPMRGVISAASRCDGLDSRTPELVLEDVDRFVGFSLSTDDEGRTAPPACSFNTK